MAYLFVLGLIAVAFTIIMVKVSVAILAAIILKATTKYHEYKKGGGEEEEAAPV